MPNRLQVRTQNGHLLLFVLVHLRWYRNLLICYGAWLGHTLLSLTRSLAQPYTHLLICAKNVHRSF
jgi:hypothetical protein